VQAHHRDLIAAGLLIPLGIAVAGMGFGYGVGTLQAMGAGFVPVALGIGLVVLGLLIGVNASLSSGAPDDDHAPAHTAALPDLRGGVCILGGVAAFVLLGEHGGLAPATFVSVLIAALGDRSNRLRDAAWLAAAMVLLALVVFKWGLHLQMPAFTWR